MKRRNFLKTASSFAILAAGTVTGVSDVFAQKHTFPSKEADIKTFSRI